MLLRAPSSDGARLEHCERARDDQASGKAAALQLTQLKAAIYTFDLQLAW